MNVTEIGAAAMELEGPGWMDVFTLLVTSFAMVKIITKIATSTMEIAVGNHQIVFPAMAKSASATKQECPTVPVRRRKHHFTR